MESSIKLEEADELCWKEHYTDNERLAVDHPNEDYSGKFDVKVELIEEFDDNISNVDAGQSINEKRNIRNIEDSIVLKSDRITNDFSSMNSSNFIDVKLELSNTSNSSLEDYRNSDGEETIWMKQDEDFSMDDEKCNSIKMEMDDSFPECVDHHCSEGMGHGDQNNFYCKYCENIVVSKSLTSHLNDFHKDECNIKRFQKNVRCRFCGNDVFSKNFMRHLERQHYEENDVQRILVYPKNSKERRHALSLFRNNTNFDLFVTGEIRPYRQMSKKCDSSDYSPCVHCKGVYTKRYLKRHGKSCFVREEKLESTKKRKKYNHLASTKIRSMNDLDHADIISRLNIKEQVFHLMKEDLISLEAKRDILIALVGEHYFNNYSNKHIMHTVISKMRELSCLLIAYRTLTKDENLSFIDIIDPDNFSKVVKAIRIIAAYDDERKKFNCPNLASNICSSLKLVCTELISLISKKKMDRDTQSLSDHVGWTQKVNIFKDLIEGHWNAEFTSFEYVKYPITVVKKPLLHTYLNQDSPEKVRKKPSLLHLAGQLKQFHGEVLKIAYQCQKELFTKNENEEAYKLLVEASLGLLFLSNKRNFAEIQFMTLEDYQDDKAACVKDYENVLSHVERVLTTKHRKVLVVKQGDEKVLILIPYIIQCFINVLLEHRYKYLEWDNTYIFAMPGSNIKWGESEVAIRDLCELIKLEEKSIGNNNFRKYTATIMGILNLSQGELLQLGHFMGCALETKNLFFELPIDANQTAKLSRLLEIMEEGPILSKYTGKCLAEIDIDPNNEFACEDNGEGEDVESPTIYDEQDDNCIDDTNQKNVYLFEDENLNENKSNQTNCNEIRLSTKDQSSKSFEKLMKFCETPYYNLSFHESAVTVFEIRKKKISDNGIKRGWTKQEIELIEKDFGCFIQSGIYPSGKEMSYFLMKNSITKTVPILRSKIQHLIRLKNKF